MPKFHTKFIAAVAAIAILVTGVSAHQAHAGNKRTENTLAALLGLAVVGAIIANKSKRDRETVAVIQKPQVIEPRPLPKRARRALPEQCLRFITTNQKQRRYYGARCMYRNYDRVDQLPERCEREFPTQRGYRQGWGARCLKKHGYKVARH